jgi:transposase-like protein
MIERGTTKFVLIPVSDRSAATLLPVIRRYRLPGTTIISDFWAAYNTLARDPNYEYDIVNRSLHFVDSEDSNIRTQNTENCWLHSKKKLKIQHGTLSEYLNGYLCDYMFRFKYGKFRCFNELLKIIKYQLALVKDQE